MKRLLLFATATAVALSSCSKDEIGASVTSQNVITFDTYAANSTKATPMTYAQLQSEGFKVSSLTTGTGSYTDMTNLAVAWDGTNNAWTYMSSSQTTTYYWPTDGATMDFVAVSTETSTNAIDSWTSGNPTITNYGLATTTATQEDLVIAFANDVAVSSTTGGVVPLIFKHAFAKVDVKIKANTTDTGIQFNLTELTLKDVNTKGTATITNASTDGGKVTWAADSTPTTGDISYVLAAASDTDNTVDPVTVFKGEASPTAKDVDSDTADHIMILPISFPTVYIKGTWTTVGDSSTTKLYDVAETITISDVTPAYNTAYTITLTITPKIPISFTVDSTNGVDGWDSGAGAN